MPAALLAPYVHSTPTDAVFASELGRAPADGEIVNFAGQLWLRNAGVWAAVESAASPIFSGVATGPAFSATGLTGAAAGARFVGATASGAPASGTFLAGDYVVDQTGAMWVCTVGGTSGTWVKVGGGTIPTSISVLGDGSGDHTNSTVTMATVAAQYSLSLAAAVSDVVIAEFEFNWSNPLATSGVQVQFISVNNSNAALNPLLILNEPNNAQPALGRIKTRLVVAAGDLSGGNVTIAPQFASRDAGQAVTIKNASGASGAQRPVMQLTNWKH